MKKLLLGLILLTGCATQEYYWDHKPFKDASQTGLEQAKKICNGSALNAADGVASPHKSDIGDPNSLSGLSASMGNLASSLAYQDARYAAYNNSYQSCMATHGWDSTLVPVVNAEEEKLPETTNLNE